MKNMMKTCPKKYMRGITLVTSLFLVISLTTVSGYCNQEIHLTNDDRLSGTIVKETNTILTVVIIFIVKMFKNTS